MGRILARSEEVYRFSNDLNGMTFREYVPDKRPISEDELVEAPNKVRLYLPDYCVAYLQQHPIGYGINKRSRDVLLYPPKDIEQDEPIMTIPSDELRAEYRRDLIYFIGLIFARFNNDIQYLNSLDIPAQYASFLQTYLDLLYCKHEGLEDTFLDKYIKDLKENARVYIKKYEKFNKRQKDRDYPEFIMNTLLVLQSFASMDAAIQVGEKYGDNVDEIRKLIHEFIVNKDHNDREHLLADRGIDTVGFKALRKKLEGKAVR